MKKIIKYITIIVGIIIYLQLIPNKVNATNITNQKNLTYQSKMSGKENIVSYENFSMGGGGTFYNAKINPKDSNNFVAISDMGGLYYSNNGGKDWNRTEARGTFREITFDQNGIIFTGAYGLYKSEDKGKTIKMIYPKEENVKYRISRAGWNENLMLADGYDNGYLKAVETDGKWVYFITVDWEGNLRFIKCDYNGDNLEILYTNKYPNINPTSGIISKINVEKTGVYFTDNKNVYYYNFLTKETKKIYTVSEGTIIDFKKIENDYYILNEKSNVTDIIYTTDFIDTKKLNDYINIENTYNFWENKYNFEWHFNLITGTSFDNIFLAFTSKDSISFKTLYSVMHFDGKKFSWVYGNVENLKKSDDDIGWSYGGYGDFYSLNVSPHNEKQVLLTNSETIINIEYDSNKNVREVHTMHNKTLNNGYYTSTGLNLQTNYGVYEDPFNSNNMIIATTDLGLQISKDAGKSFRRMELIGDNYDIYNTCYDIYYDKHTPNLVYGIWSSIHDAPYTPSIDDNSEIVKGKFAVSLDGGITWNFNYSKGLPKNCIPVKMSVVENGDNLTIAVATFNKGFYVSYDSGKTFTCINTGMDTYNGFIWGEDIIINGDKIYCLASHYNFETNSSPVPAQFYEYSISRKKLKKIDLPKDVVIARNLAIDKSNNVFICVIPWHKGEWMPELDNWFWINYGGGVYKYDGKIITQYFENNEGIYDCDFDEKGRMYAVSVYGQVFVVEDETDKGSVFTTGMFNQLKNVCFSNDGNTLYVTSFGGGTYRMPTIKKLLGECVQEPEKPSDEINNNTEKLPSENDNEEVIPPKNDDSVNDENVKEEELEKPSDINTEQPIQKEENTFDNIENIENDNIAPGMLPLTGKNSNTFMHIILIIVSVLIVSIIIYKVLRCKYIF